VKVKLFSAESCFDGNKFSSDNEMKLERNLQMEISIHNPSKRLTL